MSWPTYRRRSDALRAATDLIEQQHDHRLPTYVPGIGAVIPTCFHDRLDLVGALHLRWHSRLSRRLEEHLAAAELDGTSLREAVTSAWASAAGDAPGLRSLLDAQIADPAEPGIGAALDRATRKEQQLLAALAGLAGRIDRGIDPEAVDAGRRIEADARAQARVEAERAPQVEEPRIELVPAGSAAFLARVRAVLAA